MRAWQGHDQTAAQRGRSLLLWLLGRTSVPAVSKNRGEYTSSASAPKMPEVSHMPATPIARLFDRSPALERDSRSTGRVAWPWNAPPMNGMTRISARARTRRHATAATARTTTRTRACIKAGRISGRAPRTERPSRRRSADCTERSDRRELASAMKVSPRAGSFMMSAEWPSLTWPNCQISGFALVVLHEPAESRRHGRALRAGLRPGGLDVGQRQDATRSRAPG